MTNQALVFEVSESGFDRYVLDNSHKLPVLVEFMAVWSEPCIVMADTLHGLAEEFAGLFVFAKVDVDEQQALRDKYSVKNAPTLSVFRDGKVEFSQEGQMTAEELRLLLRGLGVVRQSDELREQARAKHMQGNTNEAVMLLTQAIQQDPANTRVAMDMVQVFLDMGELEQAKGLFNKLPDRDKQSETGKLLIGQLTFAGLAAKTEGLQRLQEKLSANPADHDARFDLAICLVATHDLAAAVDALFTILNSEPEYKEGAAREMVIMIANMLAANDPQMAKAYRQRLASLSH